MNRQKNRSYFEGWYYKQQNDSQVLALIPSYSLQKGVLTGHLQVITDKGSWGISYSAKETHVDAKNLFVRLGESYFTKTGLRLRVNHPDLQLWGDLQFGPFAPLPKGDIMGPFALLPQMECVHGILSRDHSVTGSVQLFEETFSFAPGRGYVETDRGYSFPSEYAWVHCNRFDGPDCQLTAAVATIPYGPIRFTGVIASVVIEQKEYRLATYLGGKLCKMGERGLCIHQGDLRLLLAWPKGGGRPLAAPTKGAMTRQIHENASCPIELRLYKGEGLVYRARGAGAGVEVAPKAKL